MTETNAERFARETGEAIQEEANKAFSSGDGSKEKPYVPWGYGEDMPSTTDHVPTNAECASRAFAVLTMMLGKDRSVSYVFNDEVISLSATPVNKTEQSK